MASCGGALPHALPACTRRQGMQRGLLMLLRCQVIAMLAIQVKAHRHVLHFYRSVTRSTLLLGYWSAGTR